MTREQYDAMIAWSMKEGVWEEHVQRMMEDAGFRRHYHTLRSKGSDRGFPDDVAVHERQPRLLFLELKKQNGALSAEQVGWLDDLARLRRHLPIEVYAPVRPLDRDALWLTLFEAATESEGGLHPWCTSETCGRCGPERASATASLIRRLGSSTRTSSKSSRPRRSSKRRPSQQ